MGGRSRKNKTGRVELFAITIYKAKYKNGDKMQLCYFKLMVMMSSPIFRFISA